MHWSTSTAQECSNRTVAEHTCRARGTRAFGSLRPRTECPPDAPGFPFPGFRIFLDLGSPCIQRSLRRISLHCGNNENILGSLSSPRALHPGTWQMPGHAASWRRPHPRTCHIQAKAKSRTMPQQGEGQILEHATARNLPHPPTCHSPEHATSRQLPHPGNGRIPEPATYRTMPQPEQCRSPEHVTSQQLPPPGNGRIPEPAISRRLEIGGRAHSRTLIFVFLNLRVFMKGGPEPSNFEDFCLVNVSVKYFSKLCSGTIKIQPELKYLKTILEVFTS